METKGTRAQRIGVENTSFIVAAVVVAVFGLVTVALGNQAGLPLLVAGLTGFVLQRSVLKGPARLP